MPRKLHSKSRKLLRRIEANNGILRLDQTDLLYARILADHKWVFLYLQGPHAYAMQTRWGYPYPEED